MKLHKRKLPHPTRKSHHTPRKIRHIDYIKVICWILVPILIVILLVLDALGIYSFNTERLIVLGTGLLSILLPFFSEITVKELSLKRNKPHGKP